MSKVYVNVYDMLESNYLTAFGYYALGVGVFHSGVEINGKEYCFGGHDIPKVTGVFVIEPKSIPELTLKRTYDMGTLEISDKEFQELLVSISEKFVGPSYHLITRNCNHFTEEFVKRLLNKTVPSWINRAARLGDMFPCMVPWDWIQPPELAEELDEDALIVDNNGSRRQSTTSSSFLPGPVYSETSPLLQSAFSPHQRIQGIVYGDEQ